MSQASSHQPGNKAVIARPYIIIISYQRTTHIDDIKVVPASRVAEQHYQHEDARDDLEDATELEQAGARDEADGDP